MSCSDVRLDGRTASFPVRSSALRCFGGESRGQLELDMSCIPRTRVRSWVVVALMLTLTGCGGNGDDSSGANVALAQTSAEPCPSPVTADCVVDVVGPPYRYDAQMVGGRQSDYALSVRKLVLAHPERCSG